MKRSAAGLIVALALGLLAAPLAADAQQAGKVPRIAFLSGASHVPYHDEFPKGLRELGYIEGQNIIIERRFAEGKLDRIPDLARELVRLKVDIIVTAGSPAVRAAQQATNTIPIVMAAAGDPVGSGFVASLARPGGNTTGVSNISADLNQKLMQLLLEIAPNVSRVGFLSNPDDIINAGSLRDAQVEAQVLRVNLEAFEVRSPHEFESAFGAMRRKGVRALLVPWLGFTTTHRVQIVELAAKNRLPAVYGVREFVDAGGLMSYGANLVHIYRRAAILVDKILKGTKPADLPVEEPTRFELVVNLKTAKALNLTIPASILVRADQVIQ